MLAGIWLSPLRVDLVKSETGKTVRPLPASWYAKDSIGNRSTYQLDPTNPDARKFMYSRLKHRSEEHTSELQSLMRISYAVFCLKKKTAGTNQHEGVYQTC